MSWCEVLRSPRVYLVGERQDYPSKPVKFSPPPSVSCKRRSVGKAGAPTTLTVESPPAGYRKSVGICLVNSSNKVRFQRFKALKMSPSSSSTPNLFSWSNAVCSITGNSRSSRGRRYGFRIVGKCLRWV